MSFASLLFFAKNSPIEIILSFVELSSFNAYLPYSCRMRLSAIALVRTRAFSLFFVYRILSYV